MKQDPKPSDMEAPKERDKKSKPFSEYGEGEYVGNVFGWKFSMAGIIVTAALVLIYIFLSWRNGPPPPSVPQGDAVPDTLILETQ